MFNVYTPTPPNVFQNSKKIFPNSHILLAIHTFRKSFKSPVSQTARQPTHHQILHDPLSHPVNISQIPTVTYIHPNSNPFLPTPLHLHFGKTVLSSHNSSQLKITELFTHSIYIILDVWCGRELLWCLIPLYLLKSLRPLPTFRYVRQVFPKLCWTNPLASNLWHEWEYNHLGQPQISHYTFTLY